MNDFAIEISTAPQGKTYLFSVGQAGYIIKSKSGQLLGIDLYLSDCVQRIEGHMGYKRMLPQILNAYDCKFDVVICTHPHRDHFDIDSIPELMANEHTRMFASVNCQKDIQNLEMSNENITYVKPDNVYECGDFVLEFLSCDHGSGAPDAVGVVVTVDSKKIYETGDTCLRLDRKEEYKAKGPFDVLIAPINGAYGNLDEFDCAKLADELRPKLIIPCHYGMFASHGGDPGKFLDIMQRQYPDNNFWIMTQGERLVLE